VIFLEVPKTGSSTLVRLLMSSGFMVEGDERFMRHAPLAYAISQGAITTSQANEYTIYGFVREPFSRVYSAWFHDTCNHKRTVRINECIATKENFIVSNNLARPQTFLLENEFKVNILMFEDFEAEVVKVFARHDVPLGKIIKVNQRQTTPKYIDMYEELNDTSIAHIKDMYAGDFILWEQAYARYNK